jgi:hypothetical protein
VKGYHKTCSRDAIREILDAGVDATAYVLPGSDLAQVKYDHANQQLYQLVFGKPGQFSEGDLKELAGKHDAILANTPTVTTPPSAKAAQAKYATLNDQEKSDFKRWLEAIKAVQDARAKASAAAVAAAEKAEETARLKDREAVQAEMEAKEAQIRAERHRKTADATVDESAKPALEALAQESKKLSDFSAQEAQVAERRAELARIFARSQRLPATAGRISTLPRQTIRLEPLVDPARAQAMK